MLSLCTTEKSILFPLQQQKYSPKPIHEENFIANNYIVILLKFSPCTI